MRRRPAPLALLLLALLAGTPVRAEEAVVVASAHYRLRAETDRAEAEALVALLEAGWTEMERAFGAAPPLGPDDRLEVRFHATREAWAAGLRADGITPPGDAGGFYAPGTRVAYLYRQPTPYFTRVLLLHEATHQFHYLARTGNTQPTARWYREGWAEHLSWHVGDAADLHLAALPPITLRDPAAAALAAITAPDFDLEAVVEDRTWPGYPVAWALLRYLATGDDGRPLRGFDGFCRKMDRGAVAGPPFRRAFGPPARLQPRLVAWLEASQQPWRWVFNAWEPLAADRLAGEAPGIGMCCTRDPAARLEASLEVPPTGRWRAGLVLGFVAKDDYALALLEPDGRLVLDRRRDGAWERLATAALVRVPAPGGAVRMAAWREADGVHVEVDGERFGPWAVEGDGFGLAVDACRLVFGRLVATPHD